jgi:hypothetical protein
MKKSVPDDIDGFVRKSELRRFISPDLKEMELRLMNAFEKLAAEVLETKALVDALRAEVMSLPAKLAELEAKLLAAEAAANAAADALDNIQNGPGGSMGGVTV